MRKQQPLIFLSAGESSGDDYGAEIIEALRVLRPELRFTGLGGVAMERAGQRRIVRAEDVAVMGITEILRHVPRIYARYRQLVRAIRRERPSAAILIDFPDVNFRLARHLKRFGVPVVWFASPQLWAWKRRRLRWVMERVDRMLVLFPFEERFYRARGVAAEFVGHPLALLAPPEMTREQFANRAVALPQEQWGQSTDRSSVQRAASSAASMRYAIDPDKAWIALLPGSRLSEIRQNLPAMIEAAYRIGADCEFLIPLAPTITAEQLGTIEAATRAQLLQWSSPPRVTFVRDAHAALVHARASVVASGTATVLAAVVGNPFVVVYRVSALTFAVARRLVRYPAEITAEPDADGTLPVGMVNLIAGRRIVPELLNLRFTGEAVAAALRPLLADGPERSEQMMALRVVRQSLLRGGHDDGGDPAAGAGTARVAEVVVELLNAAEGLRSPIPGAARLTSVGGDILP